MDPGLPLGGAARTRRLLHRSLAGRKRAVVIGDPHVVRRALPEARLDIVGTDPRQADITVVSAALGKDSLPRRWDCVIVTEPDPFPERVMAALGACRPGGVVALLVSAHPQANVLHEQEIELILGDRAPFLVLARVSQ